MPGLSYDLSITITRHGPKQGLGGSLTEEGRAAVQNYYEDLYSQRTISDDVPRKLISSPIHRAVETAKIYKDVIHKYFPSSEIEIQEDERLSEKNILGFVSSLSVDCRDDWFRYWYTAEHRPHPNIPVGKEAVCNFARWMLDEINFQKQKGGSLAIDAFSHGPVMAGFMLRIEEKLGTELLMPLNEGQDRLHFNKLFALTDGEFKYLSNLNFRIDSGHPDILIVRFRGNNTEVPLHIIAELAKE